jgi:hypothetical protein
MSAYIKLNNKKLLLSECITQYSKGDDSCREDSPKLKETKKKTIPISSKNLHKE